MRLRELLDYKDVVIQCHDNPDADAIASGFGIYLYLKENNIPVRFVYGGDFPIHKSNLVLMKESLNIPIEYVKSIDIPDLLITVDCQYKEGNVKYFPAKNVAVIDHHKASGTLPSLNVLKSNMGSCSTIVWYLLKKENFDVNKNTDLATALYYGLMTDTNGFTELYHPLDRDLRDTLKYSKSSIQSFRNSNLSLSELKIAGEALEKTHYSKKYRCGLVEVKPCDPNILGIISDMLLEVDGVDTCIAYTLFNAGIKLSVRSCIKEVQSNEFVEFLSDGLGSGGGHYDKAGGYMERSLLDLMGVDFKQKAVNGFIKKRIREYFEYTKIIQAGNSSEDLTYSPVYTKKSLLMGYVDPAEMDLIGKTVTLRSIEGDIDVYCDDSIYIMIRSDGEIFPIKKANFGKSFTISDIPYKFPGEYEPSVKDANSGQLFSVIPYARSCIISETTPVYARRLNERVKVFTVWDKEKYTLGKPGDYLAAKLDAPDELFIINKETFQSTYERKLCKEAI